MSLIARDKAIMWHPFTQHQTALLPVAIARGEGSYVVDASGARYLDLISSWWVNLHGHAHPVIADAIHAQAKTLEHVMFAGFTHEPAVALCERLARLLPSTLVRFFYSDNGSTCVEVALKMAWQFWLNQEGRARPLFLSFAGGYHGDTFGAMAVGAQSGYFDPFKALLFEVLTVPFPHTWQDDAEVLAKEEAALEALDRHLVRHHGAISAMIVEPLVQGAGGMRMCRVSFLNSVIKRLRRAGVLVIFDEVMTGFGRTGSWFALDQLDEAPDLLCLSKGITGGFLPLALTVTTDAIYRAFLHDSGQQALLHGHSYTANPLACASGIASFDLLVTDTTRQSMQAIHIAHTKGLAVLQADCNFLSHFRVCGTIAAFDIDGIESNTLNTRLVPALLAAGLLLRPLGRTLYLLPPYSITLDALLAAYATIRRVLLEWSVAERVC